MKHDWQLQRTMTPDEFLMTLHSLGLSQAAAGRYLGRSARTTNRYVHGLAVIPPAEVLLLRSLLNLKVEPLVPPWQADRNKHWG
jgi:hypothetical protein